MKKISFAFVGLILVVSVLINLAGCTKHEEEQVQPSTQVQDLTSGVYQHLVEPLTREEMYPYHGAINRFAMELFKESNVADENTVISPLSVLFALSMAVNGADGETLKQMEDVLGISTSELNRYLYSYADNFPNETLENRIKIEIANGLIVNSPTNIINKTILKWQTTTRHSVDSAS